MNYIDKEKSIKIDIAGIENRVRHAFNQGYDFGFKDGKEKAKSQESVLDKIIAEIEQVSEEENKVDEKWAQGLKYALKIIDKYRTESEEKV